MKSYSYPNQKKIIVITGTPGVGKTVISEALAANIGALYIGLTNLIKEENLISGFDVERGTIIADLGKLSTRTQEIICSSTRDVVVEGHFAPDVVPSNLVSHVFALRRDPDDLKVKLEQRGFEEKKVLENVASEVLDVCLISAIERYGIKKVDEIDLTDMNIEEAIEEIIQVLKGQKSRMVGKVDWLGKLEMEGRLEKFFKQID